MAWTKAKTVIVIGVGVLFAAGTTTIAVKQIKQKSEAKAVTEDESWRVQYFDSRVLDKAQPQIKILPAKHASGGYGSSGSACMGIGASLNEIILTAYQQSASRTIFPSEMPAGQYDFIAKPPSGSGPEAAFTGLQTELKNKFGLVAHLETRDTDVLILTAQNRPRPGLKPAAQQNSSSFRAHAGEIKIENRPIGALASHLENVFQQPVIDRTGLSGNYDMTFKWTATGGNSHNLDGLKNTLLEQFGMELVAGREPIEVLVVEKAN